MAEINGTAVALAPPDGYIVDFDNPRRNLLVANYVVMAMGLNLSVRSGVDCVIIAWVHPSLQYCRDSKGPIIVPPTGVRCGHARHAHK